MLMWESYRELVYGFLDDEKEDNDLEDEQISYKWDGSNKQIEMQHG